MNIIKIKEELIKQCKTFVDERMRTIDEIITSNQKALQSETKSSAGDKHETGRAMLQLEMEKASLQLASVNHMKQVLDKIDYSYKNDLVKLGSLIYTNKGWYFLAISLGEINVLNKKYYVISSSSPIGNLMLGNLKGSKIKFHGNTIDILEIY